MSGDVRTLSRGKTGAGSRSEDVRRAGGGRLVDRAAAVPTWQLLCVICGASGLTVVLLGTRLTFFNDDWYFLLQRPGLSAEAVLAPHNGHLSALAVLIYK